MRTRFLNVDFFRRVSDDDFTFFPLPLPHPPPLQIPTETEISSFDLVLDISLEFDRFPFENALSEFFSCVLPRIHDTRNGNTCCREEKGRQQRRIFEPEAIDAEIREMENDFFLGENHEKSIEAIRFEVPELEYPLGENAWNCNEEEKGICLEIPGIEIHLDILNLNFRDKNHFPRELSESIYAVEDKSMEYYVNQRKCSFGEESVSIHDRGISCSNKLLNFEVGVICLEVSTCPFLDKEFHSLLTNLGHQHWAETDVLMGDCEVLLGSVDVDILECLAGGGPSKQSFGPQPICLNSVLEMEFVSLIENMDIKRKSMISSQASDVDSCPLASTVHFHEVEILDLACLQPSDMFASLQMKNEVESLGQMLDEDMNSIMSCYESFVNIELGLVDDTIRSLPIPVLCCDKEIILLSSMVKDILDGLRPHPASTCEGIYLDWHFLQENLCHHDLCCSTVKMLEKINTYDAVSEQKSTNEVVGTEFVFSNNTADELNILRCKEKCKELPSGISVVSEPHSKLSPMQFLKDERIVYGNEVAPTNSEMTSFLLESMSQLSDLNFFLNAGKGTSRRNGEDAIKDRSDSIPRLLGVSLTQPIVISASPELEVQSWNVDVHQVKLSCHILDIINNIQVSYFSIVENDAGLTKKYHLSQYVDEYKLLSIPKQKLMDLISRTSEEKCTSDCEDTVLMTYSALYAIKQMAHYLCYFGIHPTLQYLSNLSQSLKYFRVRFSLLHSLIKDACLKADKGIIESHPSLSIIEKILSSDTNHKKVLIVADKIFWWSLKKKLAALRISFDEVRNGHTSLSQQDVSDNAEISKATLDSLLQSDYLLISHEQIFPWFPFHKFSVILEYGGSYGSSRISTFTSKIAGLPRLHFLVMELGEFRVPKALCEGFDDSEHCEIAMEGLSQPMASLKEGFEKKKLLRLLNFVPDIDKDNYVIPLETANKIETCCMTEPVFGLPYLTDTEYTDSSRDSLPDIVIIVNTKNFDKEMLLSRRSSYQKILAMEKRGVQVVERELDLPVDLIFSAAICLVWYDARNIVVSATATNGAYSCIPDCIEHIATNILMSLSFAFSSCVLVFEGESSFLAAIMESSDGLYAAAASLDMHLQVFCSYSPELTDEIILSCIKYTTKLHRGLYPLMLESETLAESFLTRFPSINPLSAHAILSSGVMLVEFLEWSCDQRIQAIGKYQVPDESITLFSALCRYGELAESKSVMTDSSSFSSALNSDFSTEKLQSQSKKQKHSSGAHTLDSSTAKCLYFEPLDRSRGGSPEPPKASSTYQSRIFSNDHEILEMSKNQNFSLKDEMLGQKQGSNTFVINDLDWNGINTSDTVHEDFGGEVIDHDTSFLTDESFSRSEPQKGKKVVPGSSPPLRPLTTGIGSHSSLPTSVEIDCDTNIFLSLKEENQEIEDIVFGMLNIESNMEVSSMRHQQKFLEDGKMHRSVRNAVELPSKVKVTSPYGETPLSNAIGSSQVLKGSPWTVEFFNRIKENTRLNQKSLPSSPSSNYSGSLRNVEKGVKRQSPSSLDGYRYQGGKQPRKTIQQKWQKRFTPVKNENMDPLTVSTWIPLDKRVTKTPSKKREHGSISSVNMDPS